jgi:hypothetical protein
MNFEFQNVVVQIFKFFTCVKVGQRMQSRFLFIVYYNTYYTSHFLNKSGSLLKCFHPKTQLLLLKIKDFKFFYPYAKGFASLLSKCCPSSLHTLRNLELLSHRSPWKCYPTSTYATYYPHLKHDLTKGLYLLLNISCVISILFPTGF